MHIKCMLPLGFLYSNTVFQSACCTLAYTQTLFEILVQFFFSKSFSTSFSGAGSNRVRDCQQSDIELCSADQC